MKKSTQKENGLVNSYLKDRPRISSYLERVIPLRSNKFTQMLDDLKITIYLLSIDIPDLKNLNQFGSEK